VEFRVEDTQLKVGQYRWCRSSFVRFRHANQMKPDYSVTALRGPDGRMVATSTSELTWRDLQQNPGGALHLHQIVYTVVQPDGEGKPRPARRTTIRILDEVGLDAESLRRAAVIPADTGSIPVVSRSEIAAGGDPEAQRRLLAESMGAESVQSRASARGPWLAAFAGAVITCCVVVTLWIRMRSNRTEVSP
jgi:hypothetical protein